MLPKNSFRRHLARGAHDAATGVGTCRAHPEIAYGRFIFCPACGRPQIEQLLERQLAVEYVALGQAKLLFEVPGCQHLPVQNRVFDIRDVLLERVDDGIAKCFASLRPVRRTFFDVVRRVLNKAANYVLAWRGHRRIDERWDDHIDVRPLREIAIFSLVVSLLEVLDARRDGYIAIEVRSITRTAGKLGQSVDSEVHFAGAATEFVVPQLRGDFAIEVLFPDQTQVRSTRVEPGYDSAGLNLIAIIKRDADGFAVFDDDVADASLGDYFCPVRLRGTRNCIRFHPYSDAARRRPFPASVRPGRCR